MTAVDLPVDPGPPDPPGSTGPAAVAVRPPVVLAVVAVGVVVALHAAMTFLLVAPKGALSVDSGPLVHRWSTPLFTQNWQLFAPDPVSDDRGLLARASDGPFTDLTTPELDGIEGHLVPARTTRLSTGAIRALQQDVHVLDYFSGARADGTCPPRRTDGDLRAEAKLTGTAVLDRVDRLATDPCVPAGLRAAYRTDRAYAVRLALSALPVGSSRVQLRLVTYHFPRFDQRQQRSSGQVSSVTFPWWPADYGR